jgi:RNA polymerase sigma factor (sigma-70 family)
MPRPIPSPLLAAAAAAADAASDAELLRRFVRDGDAPAFELVLRRHAGTVWTACRRILPEADAEDAFQAAFLVLVRKAGAVRGASAGGWLHRVAVTAALKRKARGRTVAGAVEAATSAPDPLERAELAAAVHEELARLPDRYRLPVVLCDLEGETQPAAAARLGWPVGSVAGRLSRARALLRDRLTRRGFAPAGSVLVLPLVAVPNRVVTAAVATTTGAAAPPLPVSILATGVLSAMRTAKLKLAATAVAVVGVIGAAGFGAYTAVAQPLPQPKDAGKTEPPPPAAESRKVVTQGDTVTAFPELAPKNLEDTVTNCPRLFGPGDATAPPFPKDDPLVQLQLARLNVARSGLKSHIERWKIGRLDPASLSEVVTLVDRATDAATDLYTGRNGMIDFARLRPWYEERVRVMRLQETVVLARIQVGTEAPGAEALTRAARLGAEIALLRLIERERLGNRAY